MFTMKKSLLAALSLLLACTAESADVPEADETSVDEQMLTQEVAIYCYPWHGSDNYITFHRSSGTWEAGIKIADQVIRNQLGSYDGLERPYVRLTVDGRPVTVALKYQQTVVEHGHTLDVFRTVWKPRSPYTNLGEGAYFHMTINGRPNTRYRCGSSMIVED
jgi:hypothetical protein